MDGFRGKRILITGAGGSIGSALSRALVDLAPGDLTLIDQSELGLYDLERELRGGACSANVHILLGSICDSGFMKEVFHRSRAEIVFHAAALKHVPLLETNPFAAAITNVLGTRLVVEMAEAGGAEQCVLLSTDKAVAPTSIMGATKRVAECLFLAHPGTASLKIVRLGNVLGSSGSVAPLFLEQIMRGDPVTVSHSEASRYFLTASEAVRSLLEAACVVGSGLLVPKLARAQRIVDLARFLLERNAVPDEMSRIVISGLRAGDKMAERMTGPDERLTPSSETSSLQSLETWRPTAKEVERCVKDIGRAVHERRLDDLLRAIHLLVPEYRPSDLLRSQLDAEVGV